MSAACSVCKTTGFIKSSASSTAAHEPSAMQGVHEKAYVQQEAKGLLQISDGHIRLCGCFLSFFSPCVFVCVCFFQAVNIQSCWAFSFLSFESICLNQATQHSHSEKAEQETAVLRKGYRPSCLQHARKPISRHPARSQLEPDEVSGDCVSHKRKNTQNRRSLGSFFVCQEPLAATYVRCTRSRKDPTFVESFFCYCLLT